jgi:hydroxymethylbilane synthase
MPVERLTMIRIATRKSRLALWQTEHVAEKLKSAHPELEVQLLPMSTRGDEVLDRSLAEIGGKGLFLKELEKALLDGQADIAVHSLKDVPAESPEGLKLAVVLPRADWADLWLTRDGREPAELKPGSRVGTSSLRRQSQLLKQFPGLEVVPIRGNVETRLNLMLDGKLDAVILAAAGIERLGLDLAHQLRLQPPQFLPAPGQGVIVVQCREEDSRTQALLSALHCETTGLCVAAERGVVAALGGDCRMPLAALARLNGNEISLMARLSSPDGSQCIDVELSGQAASAAGIGMRAGQAILDRGGMRIASHF